jgi:hypothetical protein
MFCLNLMTYDNNMQTELQDLENKKFLEFGSVKCKREISYSRVFHFEFVLFYCTGSWIFTENVFFLYFNGTQSNWKFKCESILKLELGCQD